MKTRTLWCVPALVLAGCGAKFDMLTCGEGTTRDGARCIGISAVTCAAGTRLENGTCVPDVGACALGTHLEAGQCLVDATACAEGTVLVGGRCVLVSTQPVPTRWAANVRACPQGTACYDGVIAADGQGGVFVAYSVLTSTAMQVGVSVSTDDGATFAEKKRLDVLSGYAINPSISADEAGHVVLAYNEYEPDNSGMTNGTGNLWVVRSADRGATWSTPEALTPPSDVRLDYKPLVSQSGSTFSVLWQRFDADSAVLLARSTDLGATWSQPITIPGNAGAYGQFTFSRGVQAMPSGDLLLGYQSIGYDVANNGYMSNAGVMTITLSTTGATTTQIDMRRLVYTRDNSLEATPALAVDASGKRPCFVFVDAPSRNYDLYGIAGLDMFTQDTKAKQLALGPGTQLAPAVAIGPQGECHVTWLDNRRGGWELWSGVLGVEGTLQSQEPVSDQSFVEDATHQINSASELAIAGGQRYAVWNDLRDGSRGVYFAKGPLTPGL